MRALLFVCLVVAVLLPTPTQATVEQKTWSAIKELYRGSSSTTQEGRVDNPTGSKRGGDEVAADYIIYPLAPWLPLGGYAFGVLTSRGYHLGDDCVRAAGTPVYAIYGGYVRYVKYHSGTGNWGWIVIVESRWNNLPFCTVYGHLSSRGLISQGLCIPQNVKIGEIGKTWENGGHTPHLHLGIHYGYYGASTGVYPSWCRGYGGSTSGWLNPTNFIAVY